MTKRRVFFSAESNELSLAAGRITKLFCLALVGADADVYGLEVTMQNDVAGIKFEYSPAEGPGWGAVVGRLVNGELKRPPIYIDRNTKLDRFDIRDVASARIDRIPEIERKIENVGPLSSDEVCLIVERCCADMFFGDFSLFVELRERVMARLKE